MPARHPRERLVLELAETRTLDPRQSAALKAGLADGVDRLDRQGRLPKVSQLLHKHSTRPTSPGSSRRSSKRSQTRSSTTCSRPHRCCAGPSTSSTSTASSTNSATRATSPLPSSRKSCRPRYARSSTACARSYGRASAPTTPCVHTLREAADTKQKTRTTGAPSRFPVQLGFAPSRQSPDPRSEPESSRTILFGIPPTVPEQLVPLRGRARMPRVRA